MPKCKNCDTSHGTQMYRENGEKVTYCVHCAPESAGVIDDKPRVVEYPDRR